jgi:hypothetical protein
MQETSVIQLEGESKVALVFGQMNEPPGARARVALTGLTVAGMFIPGTRCVENERNRYNPLVPPCTKAPLAERY